MPFVTYILQLKNGFYLVSQTNDLKSTLNKYKNGTTKNAREHALEKLLIAYPARRREHVYTIAALMLIYGKDKILGPQSYLSRRAIMYVDGIEKYLNNGPCENYDENDMEKGYMILAFKTTIETFINDNNEEQFIQKMKEIQDYYFLFCH